MSGEGMYVAYGALGLMAVFPIIVGSFRTIEEEKGKEQKDQDGKEQKETEKEIISAQDAKWFPIYGSGVLFSLYLLFRFIPKEYINLILSSYFALIGIASLVNFLHPNLSPFLFLLHPQGAPFHIIFSRGTKVYYDNKFDWAHIALAVVSSALSIYYALTKNWIASNIFGEAFALGAIQLLHLDSFRTGIIMLSGLFLYDIFWVFGTEVMVSVAKAFDAPIKVVFPKDLFAETFQFTMLGLGDIVIPGIFIALALRFDYSRAKDKKNFPKPYFIACFTAYCLGLATTIAVMQFFQAAQPALLYLSPACILSVLLTALARGELQEVLNYKPGENKNSKGE